MSSLKLFKAFLHDMFGGVKEIKIALPTKMFLLGIFLLLSGIFIQIPLANFNIILSMVVGLSTIEFGFLIILYCLWLDNHHELWENKK